MSSMSDVTIELDFDDDLSAEIDAFAAEKWFDDDDDVIIDNPITLSQVFFDVPSGVLVGHLNQEIRDVISANLNVPTGLSIASWSLVDDCLNASSNFQLDSSENSKDDILAQFDHIEAHLLLTALRKAQRIDILVKLKTIISAGNYLQNIKDFAGLSQLSTRTACSFASASSITTDQSLVPSTENVNGNNLILVLHFEKTETERNNFKWFMQNLRRNLRCRAAGGLAPMDVATLEKEDGGNVVSKLDDMFKQFPHIIVCFNASYLSALYAPVVEKEFQLRKIIHEKTVIEFVQNNMRNKRCRCVLMPDTTKLETTDWSAVTYQYKFPDEFPELLGRLLKINVKLKNNTL